MDVSTWSATVVLRPAGAVSAQGHRRAGSLGCTGSGTHLPPGPAVRGAPQAGPAHCQLCDARGPCSRRWQCQAWNRRGRRPRSWGGMGGSPGRRGLSPGRAVTLAPAAAWGMCRQGRTRRGTNAVTCQPWGALLRAAGNKESMRRSCNRGAPGTSPMGHGRHQPPWTAPARPAHDCGQGGASWAEPDNTGHVFKDPQLPAPGSWGPPGISCPCCMVMETVLLPPPRSMALAQTAARGLGCLHGGGGSYWDFGLLAPESWAQAGSTATVTVVGRHLPGKGFIQVIIFLFLLLKEMGRFKPSQRSCH